ncbi:hypothetical protein AX16_009698 [Volvariella volvacea WC 439]|nr:hypothetical protein AX16_009698 [Volvariella volvacea WC 439]
MDTLGTLIISGIEVYPELGLVDDYDLYIDAHILVDGIEVERFALRGVTSEAWFASVEVSLPAKVSNFRLAISGTIQGLHRTLGHVDVSALDLFGRCLSFEDVYIASAQLDSDDMWAMRIQFCYTFSICEFIQTLELTSSPESTFTPDVVDSIQEIFIMTAEPIILSNKSGFDFIRRAISDMPISKHYMRPGYLSKIVQLFEEKYQSTRNVRHLHNTMEALADLVLAVIPNEEKLGPLMDKFGKLIQEWSDRRQDHGGTGLERAIDAFEEGLQYIPENYSGRPLQLFNLAAWYIHQADPKSLDRAIAIYEATQTDPNLRLDSMLALGDALNRRFRLYGDVEDLDRASQVLSIHKPAKFRPHHGANWWVWIQRWLRHLNPGGTTATVLLEEMSTIPILADFSKELGLLAFELYPHPTTWLERGLFWDSSNTPRPVHRFGEGINPSLYDTLNAMIEEHNLLRDVAPQLHMLIGALLLHIKFFAYNDPDDLDRAIQLALDSDSPKQPMFSLFDIEAYRKSPEARWLQAIRYMTRYRIRGNVSDLKLALPIFKDCAKSKMGVSIGLRLSAATWWGILATRLGEKDDAIESYMQALDVLPEVPWLGLPLEERHKQLFYNESLAPFASAAALQFDDCYRAVEWSEQGRSVIWNQLLQLRVSTEGLERVNPDLANRFASVCADLQADKVGSILDAGDQKDEFLAQAAQIYYPLVSEREDLINRIRRLPGFETFLFPRTIDQLREATQHGPIVILNASRYPDRCDALIMLPELEEVIHIPLPKMTHSRARALQHQFASLITTSGRSITAEESRYGGVLSKMKGKKGSHRPKVRTVDTVFAEILQELWYSVVHPILDGLAMMNVDIVDDYAEPDIHNLTRVWWCPIGPFASLPLHAAGDYSRRGQQVFNYVISSYTPTVSALLTQRRESPIHEMDQVRLLAVIQSASDTGFPLPGTHEELRLIQSRIANTEAKIELDVLYEDDAKREMTLDKIQQANWVHFACHGIQDITNPTNSALLLAKGSRLRLHDLIKLSLPNAQLAFLSACQTATGVSTLPDEAIHLAAGMLLAGFRSIIATLWSIGDSDAPRVADDVYATLLDSTGGSRVPDAGEAAFALHCAVDRLRKGYGNKSFMNWVPYVHIGL